jgi:Cys-tRNA(Pro)/Cys-tRNA(Cys) deacylase
MQKTNAMRELEIAKIPYEPHEYSVSDGVLDAVSVAGKLGAYPGIVFKTLVTCSENSEIFVFVIPGSGELDLKAAARAAGKKKLDMLPQKELLAKTGYIHGGCSPVGMKKKYAAFIDSSAVTLPVIYVSGGRPGLNLSLCPRQLATYLGAGFAELTGRK